MTEAPTAATTPRPSLFPAPSSPVPQPTPPASPPVMVNIDTCSTSDTTVHHEEAATSVATSTGGTESPASPPAPTVAPPTEEVSPSSYPIVATAHPEVESAILDPLTIAPRTIALFLSIDVT
ncbi:uncharacterized protein LOC131165923 [Malania oleifera]|uniref:uncharacterized protein LOC131165923 n=1 Tax=Malania oleifera TaxID=397392 RepID=UPI0025ADD017|nr:uncharacterized protein LOC131165923 [Malania oleifera]